MDEIMTNVNQLANGGVNQEILRIQNLAGQNTTALIIAIAIGVILCLFGLKLMRVLAAVAGLCIGVAIGIPIAQLIGLEGIAFGGVMLACGVVLAVLSCIFYKAGVFLWAFIAGTIIGAVFLSPDSILMAVICLVIGLIVAVITVIFLEPLVIIISSINGGLTAGAAIAVLTGLTGSPLIVMGISLVLTVAGMVVQFMMRSRELGRKEQAYSKEIKAKASREAEVEKARMLLDDDEPDDDESDSDDDIKFVE